MKAVPGKLYKLKKDVYDFFLKEPIGPSVTENPDTRAGVYKAGQVFLFVGEHERSSDAKIIHTLLAPDGRTVYGFVKRLKGPELEAMMEHVWEEAK